MKAKLRFSRIFYMFINSLKVVFICPIYSAFQLLHCPSICLLSCNCTRFEKSDLLITPCNIDPVQGVSVISNTVVANS